MCHYYFSSIGTTCEGLQGLETYDVPQFVPLKPSIPAPPIPCSYTLPWNIMCTYYYFAGKNPFSLEREPGKYKFSLVCKRHTYSSEINTLFIHMQTNFAVEFELEDAVTPNESMSFRVLVTYSDLADVAKLGPVQPCSCNAHVKSRSKFSSVQFFPQFYYEQGHLCHTHTHIFPLPWIFLCVN